MKLSLKPSIIGVVSAVAVFGIAGALVFYSMKTIERALDDLSEF